MIRKEYTTHNHTRMTRSGKTLPLLLLAAALLAGCGSGSGNASTAETAVSESTSVSESEAEASSAVSESEAADSTVPEEEDEFGMMSAAREGDAVVFETMDVYGETVDSAELFGNHTYTLINLWASWCGPCIGELPELEVISGEFEEKGCAVIGILEDGTDVMGLADALEILDQTGVTYTNLIPTEEMMQLLAANVVPVSYFVDSEGKLVGEPIFGAQPDVYRATLEQLLSQNPGGSTGEG